MPVEKVQLGVTAIKELLDNGYTWLKKDDLGFGSIQEKYQASDLQIAAIRKHPALKDLETTARIFVIIDDTKDEKTATSGETSISPIGSGNDKHVGTISQAQETIPTISNELFESSDQNNDGVSVGADTDSFSAFANL